MAYCTIDDVKNILPENIKIGDQNIGTPIPGRPGNQGSGRSNVTTTEVNKYILYAQEYIDSRLRPIYVCPLRRIKSFETEVIGNISAGRNIVVDVRDTGPFSPSTLIRLQSDYVYENCNITDINDFTQITLDTVINNYQSSEYPVISILEYPDPIPTLTSRLAASYIYDRYFVAEQEPDVSSYGKTQRNLARDGIENILTGEVMLTGQDHTNRRFIRMSLLDVYKSPAEIQRASEPKE